MDIVKNGDGFAVGYTQKGEWLEYTVNVQAEGALSYALHYASGSESSGVQFFMDDEAVTDTLKLESTGDWDTYKTLKGKTTKALAKGEHVFKVLITGDYVNLDWIAFGESEGSAEDIRNGKTDIVPKIAHNGAGAAGMANAFARAAGSYRVFDLMGSELGNIRLNAGATLTDLKAGLKTAGFGSGVYVVRNPTGKTLKLQVGE